MARKNIFGKQSCNHEQMNEKIRQLAQQLYEKRGRVPGHELDDWLKAEQMVKKSCT